MVSHRLTHEELRLVQAYRFVRRHQRRAIYQLAIAAKCAREHEKAVAKEAKQLIASTQEG